jgi:membrane protein
MIRGQNTHIPRGTPFRLTRRVVWSLLGETFFEWYEDRAPRLGAALAYYTVFALAPGLILIIALAALLLGKDAAQGQIISEVQDLAGEAGAQAVLAAIESARNAGGSLLATGLGVVTLLFGLWGVFGELQDALNTIWGVTTRPGRGVIGVIKQRFWSFTVVVGIGFLLLVSLAASAWLAALGKVFSRLLPLPVAMMETTNALLSFVVITFMFAVIYKLLPDVTIAWRNVWTGAAVTAVLFTIGKTLIGLYLGRSSVASVYGAAGSLIVLLLWVYYSAQLVFFGAEFTKVYARRFGAPSMTPRVEVSGYRTVPTGLEIARRVFGSTRRDDGQAHHELAPPAGALAVGRDGPAVELDQDAGQREAHTKALLGVGQRPIGLRAQIEDER